MANQTVTDLLARGDASGPEVVDELVPLLYEELRSIAHRFLAAEQRQCATLGTTALVHEAYLKLIGGQSLAGRGRAYFFGAVARAMRQVLVDAARRRRRIMRGGGERAIPLSGIEAPAEGGDEEVLAVNEALSTLETLYPRQARVIECRFFGGLSVEQTAEALEVSPRTVKRDWSLAQAWLYRELKGR